MSAITYIALREIEPTLSKGGVDISASATDDSFNAAATSLAGLLSDEWISITGFSNAANNGWFQLQANSVTGKILTLTEPITHVRLPGTTGNSISTPDSVNLFTPLNLDVRVKCALQWSIGSERYVINHGPSWVFGINNKTPFLYASSDGTNWDLTAGAKYATVGMTVNDFDVRWVRFLRDQSSGQIQFFFSLDYEPYTGTGTWTQIGATIVAGVTAGSVFNTTGALTIDGWSQHLINARIYFAEIRNQDEVRARFDASRGLRNATTLVATTGETWTINQSGTPPAILQGRALVTEAAGPNVTIQGYKRGLNQSYSIEAPLQVADRNVKTFRSSKQPIGGGAPEILLQRREVYIDVRTSSIEEAVMPQWREFLASVEGGETFTFDRYGTIATPIEPKTVQLASDNYNEAREFMFRYRISFRVRVL